MSDNHPIKQKIISLFLRGTNDTEGDIIHVGSGGITKIEACEKCGEMAMIPYLRVWKGDECVNEFCQHAVEGIRFETKQP